MVILERKQNKHFLLTPSFRYGLLGDLAAAFGGKRLRASSATLAAHIGGSRIFTIIHLVLDLAGEDVTDQLAELRNIARAL